MERSASLEFPLPLLRPRHSVVSVGAFVLTLIAIACGSAILAGLVPLQFSIVTVFLFAGPHNWFEARYFLMRLPVRFGRSRNFFLIAFAGIGLLTITYVALPLLYYTSVWAGANWSPALASWSTLLLLWIGTLVSLRAKQKLNRDWSLIWPIVFALIAGNWLAPQLFSLAIVYAHPLVALWFLDRHLRRTRPEWVKAYHRCLALLPLLMFAVVLSLWRSPALPDDNGLAWRITQHAGGTLLPGVSTHLLVSMHVFLEMLHYGVWLVALPFIGTRGRVWDVRTIPVAGHPRGFPRLILAVLIVGVLAVLALWFGFSANYALTRDIYFAVAIAHVVAEAPFLLRMI